MFTAQVFQFHKGTIRTIEMYCPLDFSKRFQFHKGTIRTADKEQKFEYFGNFNSIKVQLEL